MRSKDETLVCVGMIPNLMSRKTLQAIAFSIAMLGTVNIARKTGGIDGVRIIAIVRIFPPTVILAHIRNNKM